ncbi:thiamine-phosphate kinase [Pontibacter sp. G13]|uniref:thiamine-phosphate kinase n=1 Tax=Pontibacter sp. G13 TaxID=3074898 RepID=UPI00288A8B05|nr:thiamine-phosphate kinase [Pontibacter sp. G13]WNJ15914.1 thiamine-phosphate kinase [Pontibacter sp. G13]
MHNDGGSGLTPISSYGEFGLINHLTQAFPVVHPHVIKGIGDDAAVIQPAEGLVQVISTDLLLEGVHFDLSYVPLRHLGYKSIAVNLSDIAAMNAQPLAITVSIGMSNRFPVEALEELYAGMKIACEKYQVDLIGGDTSSSKQGLMISVTAVGQVSPEAVTYRKGAKKGDLIVVSGDVGAAYAGLLVLDREKSVYMNAPDLQPDLTDYDYVVGRQLRPDPRVDVIYRLKELGIQPTSMIDISDGIASELHHLCFHSKCGATIYAHKLPIDFQTVKVGEEFEISPVTFALNGGEDYELMFTIPIEDFEKIKTIEGLSVVGHITDEEGIMHCMLESGEAVEITADGFQHFKDTDTNSDSPESEV